MTSTDTTSKPFKIEKRQVYEAYKAVKSNHGAAGVDGQTLEMFERDLAGNLYRIWNRMSSGTYFPPPVRAVPIPKKTGGERILGVPTVSDRIAQMVVKQAIEPKLESIFLPDSYGYRPGKSALDAVGVTRQRCWKYDWVLEFDIKGLFDNLPHDLLLKAVRKNVQCKWALLYIERWLTAPMEKDGERTERTRGTPQGGVISPVCEGSACRRHAVVRRRRAAKGCGAPHQAPASTAPCAGRIAEWRMAAELRLPDWASNLFLHYAFDLWMARTHPDLPWCRYADDGLVHCRTEKEAEALRAELQARLAVCGLQMHPTKTQIVYCKDNRRRRTYPNVKFDFLGYQFRPRRVATAQRNEYFCGYTPAVSPAALKSMRETIRSLRIPRQTPGTLAEIAQQINPLLRGWIEYYGRFSRSGLAPLVDYVNQKLKAWIMRKYKRFRFHKTRASVFLRKLAQHNVDLFVHWQSFGTVTFT